MWLIISLIMYGISSALGGQGSFKRLFEFTGYGFVPSIISSLITTPVMAYYISSAVVPKLSMADIQSGEFAKDFMRTLMPADVVYFNLIISIAFLIWSFTIWTFGVKNARELEMNKAILTVLIPLIAYIAYTAYAMLNFL
ncbi:MAG TPA: YIP1 family protein [Archaeoglobaceae archaeon]|nr:YIP1 family protein [Archaeoglobaceae archaeon]